MTHVHRKPVHIAHSPVRAPAPAPAGRPQTQAPAPTPRPAARPVDVFEAAPRRAAPQAAHAPPKAHEAHKAHETHKAHEAQKSQKAQETQKAHELQAAQAHQAAQAARAAHATHAPASTRADVSPASSRKQRFAHTVQKELNQLPVSAHERKQLEKTALHPGHSREDRRAARDLRRVLLTTRKLPPSVQEGMVKPFVKHPHGTEARAAASLTRRKDFRTAPTEQREAMARVFPHTNPINVGKLASATRQVFSAPLTGSQRQHVLNHAFSRKSDPQVRLDTRDVLQALRHQAPQVQADVLRPLAAHQNAWLQAGFANRLVHSSTWTQGGPTERGQLAGVFGTATSPEAHGSLDQLLQTPARLMDRDATGGTLLANLATLAKGPLHASIPESRRAELLNGVLQETARPGEVNQANFGSCTVTSMQFELTRDNPSEYARLIAGLTGPAGRVGMQGGGELELQPDSLDPRAVQGRSFSEDLFQSAAMEFANGEDDYQVLGGDGSTGLDQSVHHNPDGTTSTYGGQSADGMVRIISALFGRSFSSWPTTDSTRAAQLDFLRNYQPAGTNSPVLISFDTNGRDVAGGGHAVTFVGMSNDRVFFRNPWGQDGQVAAGQEVPSGARMEDPSTGLYSFSLEQFRDRVYNLTVPEEARPFRGQAVA